MYARSLSAGRMTDTACTGSTVRRAPALPEDEALQCRAPRGTGERPALARRERQVERWGRQVLELGDQPLPGARVHAAPEVQAAAGVDEDDRARRTGERLRLALGQPGQDLL